MSYPVRVEEVGPRVLAVVRGSATRATLGPTIIRLLDQVWPVLRAQGLKTDHNIVIYHGGLDDIEVGVEIVGGQLLETDVVKQSRTPAGPAAVVTHFGTYAAVRQAYVALERYCAEHHLARTPVSWEIYGDWSDNPAEQRMDVFWLLEASKITS